MGTIQAPPAATDQEADPRLAAYYADRALMWRNVVLIQCLVVASAVGIGLAGTLSGLHMRACGLGEDTIALLNSINLWVVGYLVMYFSWRSDHTVSKLGRRTPYVLLSLPFIVVSTALFPYFTNTWSLILLYAVKMLFLDMKASTQPLLRIDCVPRDMLGRVGAITTCVTALSFFAVTRYGMRIADSHPTVPFVAGSLVMAVMTLICCRFLREPPVTCPATTGFRPWSALAIGCRDRRIILLMVGVALIGGFYQMFGYWNTFWTTAPTGTGLGFSKADYGDAISWQALAAVVVALPCGWIIDRCSGYRVVAAFWCLQLVGFAVVVSLVHDASTFLFATILCATGGGLGGAAEIMVFKTCDARHVGSVTSSLSLFRNVISGTVLAISGWLVVNGGTSDYGRAYVFGMVLATAGLACFWGYRRLMAPPTAPAASPALAVPAETPA
jgi:hypothetical protein